MPADKAVQIEKAIQMAGLVGRVLHPHRGEGAGGQDLLQALVESFGVKPLAAQILEALGVLQYFAGISVVINGLGMAQDANENVKRYLRGEG